MRQLATIQIIAEKKSIEGADAIEAVRVRDWWCVAKKDEFQVGDRCIYFEIDSLLPITNPSFDFLAKGSKPKNMEIEGKVYTGYRLKTIKLKGQLSQGLALPLSMLAVATDDDTLAVGDDLSGRLGIVKYEKLLPAQLSGKVKGQRPGYIPKTDEERVQNLGDVIEKHQGTVFYVTEKLDGSSGSFFRHTTNTNGSHFGVCSRNLELLDTPENTFWNVARKYKLDEVLPEGYCVQGEVVGEGIQGNPLKIKGHDLYVYNVYNINEGSYLDFKDYTDFCDKLNLKRVPVIDPEFTLSVDVESLILMADGKSTLCETADREGLVFRPLIEKTEVIAGILGRLSFKAISNIYLLAGHD